MDIWDADKDFAFTPIESRAIASNDELTFSPVETKASNSLRFGFSEKFLARLINLFVSPLIAETTTTSLSSLEDFLISCATAAILSTEPTEVPPNF